MFQRRKIIFLNDYNYGGCCYHVPALSFRRVCLHLCRVLKFSYCEPEPAIRPKLFIKVMNFVPTYMDSYYYYIHYCRTYVMYVAVEYRVKPGYPRPDGLVIVACSEYTKKKIEEAGYRVDKVIPHAINVVEPPKNLVEFWRQRLGKYIVYVGANSFRKGLDKLYEAMKIVWQVYPDVKLVLRTGDHTVHGFKPPISVKELAKDPRVVIIRQELPEPYLFALVKGAVCYVQPSYNEGFGLPIIEAAALSVPTVCAPFPTAHEILKPFVGKTVVEKYKGIRVMKSWAEFELYDYDAKDLAEKIIYALEHPDIGVEQQEYVNERYSEEVYYSFYEFY